MPTSTDTNAQSSQRFEYSNRNIPYNSIRHVLSMHAKTAGRAPYLITIDETGQRVEVNYVEFNARAHQTANFLYDDAGVGRGDAVAIVMRGDAYSVLMCYACWIIGAVVVALNPDDVVSTHMQRVSDSGATVIVASADDLHTLAPHIADLETLVALVQVGTEADTPFLHFDALVKNLPTTFLGDGAPVKSNDDALPEGDSPLFVQLDDPALFIASDTTFSQYQLLVGAAGMVNAQGITGGQRIASDLPLHTPNGIISALLVPLLAGASTVISQQANVARFWQRLTQEKASIAILTAEQISQVTLQGGEDMTAGRGLLGENISRRDLTRFRHVVCGDNGLMVDIAEAFEDAFGFAVFNSLSHPQVAGFITLDALALSWNRRRALRTSVEGAIAVGLPTPFTEVRVTGDNLLVRGHHVCVALEDDWLDTGYPAQSVSVNGSYAYWFVVG